MHRILFLLFIFSFTENTHAQGGSKIEQSDTCKIPSLFTPNDDGVNDLWEIACLPTDVALNKSELRIYSEWGEQLGLHRPYKNDWNGDYKGKPLPDGTYFYIFKLTPDLPAQRGYITIFR